MIEPLHDIPAEEKACTARGETPAFDVVWVGPEEVAHAAFVGYFLLTVDKADLIHAVDERREPAMNAKNRPTAIIISISIRAGE